MAQEKPNPLIEWLLAVRSQIPILRSHFLEWIEMVRDEPRLIWETPAVRYGVYAAGGIVLLLVVSTIPTWLGGSPPDEAQQQAATADFHVVCSDERCGYHFIVHRELGFSKFPVTCLNCQQKTGDKARLCTSAQCRSRWVAPTESDDRVLRCPRCAQPLE